MTVDHYWLNPHAGQQGEVAKDRFTQLGVHHGGTAVFDNDPPPGESLDVGQGFTENGDSQGVVAGHRSRSLPSMLTCGLSRRLQESEIDAVSTQILEIGMKPFGEETP